MIIDANREELGPLLTSMENTIYEIKKSTGAIAEPGKKTPIEKTIDVSVQMVGFDEPALTP